VGTLTSNQRESLAALFGDRVTFDRTERALYGHDIASLPSLARPLVGRTVPDAVVQPETEAELVELVRWAGANGVALTPRGRATSGYGGVLPVRKGIVVDFYRMQCVQAIDAEARTATAQAGVVWEKLDAALEPHGLTLRLYPASYPGSTAGGWLAQGGAGIGSFEAGWFRDNVVSARVVMGDGSVREFQGTELDLVSDAEGITGLISELTVRVMPREELAVVAIGCPTSHTLQRLVEFIVDERLPVWSLSFINPSMAALRNTVPLREHYGEPAEERVLLPEAYVATLACRARHRADVEGRLAAILKPCEAEVLSERIARHEWESRSKLMGFKRLGPSLVPAEAVVPLGALGDMLAETARKVAQPIVHEGIVVRAGRDGRPEAVILGFIPSDERRLSFNFIYALSLTMLRVAERHGGRAYATGLYFAARGASVLGAERVARLRAFKKRADPHGILNPRKVLGNGLLGGLLRMACAAEPLVRPFAGHVVTHIGERPTRPIRGVPADIAWYAYSCAQCGYCLDGCDQFYGRGWESHSPRGKWFWLRQYMERRAHWNRTMAETLLACTTCELCEARCPLALPIESSWMRLRRELVDGRSEASLPAFELMAAALRGANNVWAGRRADRAAWFPPDLLDTHGPGHPAANAYLAGCTASFIERDVCIASVRLLDAAGVDFTTLGEAEDCCGMPMLVAGKWERFAQIVRDNIRAVREAGATTVVTSCPSCDMMWRLIYPAWAKRLGIPYDIRARHYSELVAERIRDGSLIFPERDGKPVHLTWHDSCHLGRVAGVFDAPRQVIQAMPGVELHEMERRRADSRCCGNVITLVKDPAVAAEVAGLVLDEAQATGADKLLSLCPCCQLQFRIAAARNGASIEVVDLAHFAAEALGFDLPDPLPEVERQWACFEPLIALMQPAGMADLMAALWPEILATLSDSDQRMMQRIARLPGAAALLRRLLRRRLPTLAPRVAPVLCGRVAERVPMPESVAEQLPELMPRVLDALVGPLADDLARRLAPSLAAHLRAQ